VHRFYNQQITNTTSKQLLDHHQTADQQTSMFAYNCENYIIINNNNNNNS